MLKPDALNRWLDRLGPVRTLTSAADAWLKGYDDAVKHVFSEPKEARARVALTLDPNYSSLRQALDEAEDDFHLSRPMAQFYLAMSPKMFTKALGVGPHPFAQPRGGATKGEVDAWFHRLVAAGVATGQRVFKRARSPATGRPYLVSEDGLVLGDAMVLNMPPHDAARALAGGADIRVMKLDAALSLPWADPTARKPWAQGRMAMLERQLEEAQALASRTHLAIARAKGQDLEATLPMGEPVKKVDPFRF